jgi:monoamine oxidase
MARTPLFSSLERLFHDLRASRSLGVPLDAVREQRANRPVRGGADTVDLTRRQWLTGTAALAAATVLPGCGEPGPMGDDRQSSPISGTPRIAIVGAGLAGLNCALTLRDRGIDATVYEGSNRIGGRVHTNRSDYFGGQVTEVCGEFIDSGHETMRKLARRFGLRLDNLLGAQPRGSDDVYHFFGRYYPKSQADAEFAALYDAVVADEAAAPFPTTHDAFTAHGQMLDQMTVAQYIDSRIPGGRGSPLGQLLDVAYASEYAADTTEQSALNILYLLAYQPDEARLSLYGESDEKFHVRGGNQQIPLAIAEELGASLETGHRLVRIEKRSSSYRLSFDVGSRTKEVLADYVVLAIPFAVLREIDTARAGFDDLKRRAIRDLGRGSSSKLQLQFDRRDWLGAGAWPELANGSSFADLGYQCTWEATRAQAGTTGILVFFSGGSAARAQSTRVPFGDASLASVRSDAMRALDQIAPVFPGLQWNGKATQSLRQLNPLFNLSYSFYRVGQYTTFGGYEKVRQDGVLFAGEHTSTDFQGYMEGAASEGERAAAELAEMLGLARPNPAVAAVRAS